MRNWTPPRPLISSQLQVSQITKSMRPPSRHAAFFSSLKQVEKRLASESSSNNNNPSQIHLFSSTTATDNLDSSPIYLNYHQPTSSLARQESDPPHEFLSHSIEFPPTPQNPSKSNIEKCNPIAESTNEDEIVRLMDLLGLSYGGEGKGDLESMFCFCNGGFYSKIAGVKGPKCEKESKRLEGWIGYFLNDGGEGEGEGEGERREPLRLAHLLLAKAACLDDGFGGIEFPHTVEEFLNNDPPLPNTNTIDE